MTLVRCAGWKLSEGGAQQAQFDEGPGCVCAIELNTIRFTTAMSSAEAMLLCLLN